MARIETVRYRSHRAEILDEWVDWKPCETDPIIETLPLIFWTDGKPWREVNLWFFELASDRAIDIKTVNSKASSLLTYAKWLEENGISWSHFPEKKSERCLDRYRGALVLMRHESDLAPSTVSHKIRVVVQFYKWLVRRKLFSPQWPMWVSKTIGISYTDKKGFSRVQEVSSTSLAIPNRKRPHERLEDGVWPVSEADREIILDCAEQCMPVEISLMLLLGFHTGMRVQTITDLKVQTLLQAIPHPLMDHIYLITVGPGASPTVATKYDVFGQIEIPKLLLDQLIDYAYSTKRILRKIKAKLDCQDLVFLTKIGNPYARRGFDTSTAINVAMHKLREIGKSKNIIALSSFHFHQSRATFATEYAIFAVSTDPQNAISLVMRALLQKDEVTALRYIKFAKRVPIRSASANKFTQRFLGRFYVDHTA
ncbi:site-specific integrase [Pseudomonas sp. A-R-26]|uniref:site-specific integrase n=1 Tax=Pseudomonas sp. A-R-26 TaxID=2832404 RepID=UPI001CBEFBB5|nr:site-specific integrase [Pseudomonas sp. A-R-26]